MCGPWPGCWSLTGGNALYYAIANVSLTPRLDRGGLRLIPHMSATAAGNPPDPFADM
jgi:hypothetical protein